MDARREPDGGESYLTHQRSFNMALPARYRGAGYRAWLSEDLGALIESKDLSLSNLQKGFVRSRWLQQVLRLDYELQRALKKYQALRLATALGWLVILMLGK